MVTVLPTRAVMFGNICLPLGSQLTKGLCGVHSGPLLRGQEAAYVLSPCVRCRLGSPTGVMEHSSATGPQTSCFSSCLQGTVRSFLSDDGGSVTPCPAEASRGSL